jgi:predicted RNase H-like HicB family nuclease
VTDSTNAYLVLIQHDGRSWAASCPDLPGVRAAGESSVEAEQLIRRAVAARLEALAASGEPIPEPATVDVAACSLLLSSIAISDSRKGASLRAILESSDYLNRGRLDASELEHAVQRLLGAELIEEVAPNRFRLSPAGREVWKETGWQNGVIDRFVSVAPLLDLGPWRPWTLDRAAFERAAYGRDA